MNFEPRRLVEYSDAAVLAEVRRVASVVGDAKLTVSTFEKHSKVGVTTLRRRFGSWLKALEAAGLGELYNRVPPASKSRVLARAMSDQQLLEEIQRVAALIGGDSISADDLKEHAVVGVDAVRRRFGSLKAALRAAGLREVAKGRRYTDEECFENLLTVWTHYGRPPLYQEMSLRPSLVGPKAYIVRWKTWTRALQAFSERVNSEGGQSSAPEPAPSEPARQVALLPAEDQRRIRLGLRYKVLMRDHFKCVICGVSPAVEPKCRLHVDHIIPWSKGGKTLLQNLRTLCEDCNIGKSDDYEPRNAG
jgi:hypothetical protein